MQEIKIKGLFGRFDYDIELAEGGITVLTGPNGFGKSTIIKCINALNNSDLEYFFELNFSEVEIIDSFGKRCLRIQKDGEVLSVDGKGIEGKKIRFEKRMLTYARRLNQRREEQAAVRGNGLNTRENDVFQMIGYYSQIIECMKRAVGQVAYIREQRLIEEKSGRETYRGTTANVRAERQILNIVDSIPHKLFSKMRDSSAAYSNVANELDSTYPERLFNQNEGMEQAAFDEKMEFMRQSVEKLNRYGISRIKKLNNVTFREEDARALKIYFDDFEKKYREYEPLIKKLDLYTDIVNRRFKFKRIEISDADGMSVVDIESAEKIKLSHLSSGEQETLVLFYQLLFEIPDNVLLLLDEPEISLHIAWQRMFADDLKKIVDIKKLRVIIATHSPQIINGNREIQIDLGAMYKDGLHKRK